MSLRLKLLLLGLLTLVLPWAGCQYAREMEAVLRQGEQQALLTMAQSIAASLQGREALLYRAGAPPLQEEPGAYDLQPLPLSGAPFVDGFPEGWPQPAGAWRAYAHGESELRVLAGVHERMLYLLLEVRDARLVFDAPGSALESAALGDRVWLGFEDPKGGERQVFIGTSAAGLVRARRIEVHEYGRREALEEPRIEGAWQPMAGGWRVELRVPLSMLGERFGVLVDDRDSRGAEPVSFGSLEPETLRTLGRLIVAPPELARYLAQFSQPGLRLTVATAGGAPLARDDALLVPAASSPERGLLARLYRRFLDQPGERRRVAATAPIYDAERRTVIGQLQVEQAADRWLTLRDGPLTRLLNLTLVTSALAVLAMLAFAARLALRLGRLRRASETALTREGLVTTFPETQAPDELGDVARSFSTLLGRLNEYTGYLRTLAGKLAHEIRTPLTIVRSSLENLESEPVSYQARAYLERARQGSERLHAILVAMGAATRVEEAIGGAERVRFDLVPVIRSAVESYRTGFPQRRFAAELPAQALEIDGAPDLIVQMLDKLIDNAVDFSPPDATLTVRLRAEPEWAVIEVENPGPPLSAGAPARLFESLWQSRPGGDGDGRPHFGLGLYIVRLIAEFHRGEAAAANLPDGSGVRFTVRLGR